MTKSSTSHGDREDALAAYVGKQVSVLQDRYRSRHSDALAAMAKLRRGVGGQPGSNPELWELTLGHMPEVLVTPEFMSCDERDGVSTVWERAAFDAITLHALHQQSRVGRMHTTGGTVGSAAQALGVLAGSQQAVQARFQALGTATDHDARLVHLRGLISQFRSFDIPLDYARLAVDLRRLDDGFYADRVLLKWARDYRIREQSGKTPDAPETGD
ncbi:type I-E CRISPR-associated protein Cse2/CasB [Nocardia cyriacigeorgica]|uniref:type I-E CRISPR-associated protein Cse2/CasB n=1 Tax=Nocardia cyriacigeorgica TaxID=135487 RepID=UPI0013B8DBDC|nr:type I-E CRISPR-associated protein Cse2/CasB [Nocardia cyriacigeorgica]NEW51649.1 type I-E CRISPR-associated protein Cse2/CasB [Nocardia cyriacigeorgica]